MPHDLTESGAFSCRLSGISTAKSNTDTAIVTSLCHAARLPLVNALTAEQRFALTAVWNAAGIPSAVSAMTTTWRILA